MKPSRSGFTIVEMIIVITVIGILAGITIVAFNGTQQKARDNKRLSDMQHISDALKLYRTKFGSDIQTGSGCGSSGNGNGWFNYSDGSTYPASTLSCLTSNGYLNPSYTDPSGCITTGSGCANRGGYMKYTCGTGDAAVTYLYAHMETTDDSANLKTLNVCSSNTVATNYGMNYMLKVD